MSSEDPDVYIESESQLKAMQEQQKLQFQAQLPILLQDPNVKPISKQFAQRKAFKLMGLSRDEINVLVPPSFEEMDAQQKVRLINADDPLGAQIDNIDVDHYTYLVYFDTALDTPTKYKAIEMRKQAIILT